MKVVVSIVSWNHARYLADALNSVRAQTHPDVSVVVVDNGSTDGTEKIVREVYPDAALIRNVRNLGFSRAHNQAIEYARVNLAKQDEDTFVFVMNPDIILKEDFLERLLERVAHRADIGSAGGKLLRVYEVMDGDLREKEFSDVVDSTGLRMYKSRRVVDRDSGAHDGGGFARTEEVFGISGAAVLYRLRALVDASVDGEYFDEDFFAYKEDVDLAWRLRLKGWRSLYVPDAQAYHYRRLAGVEKASWLAVLRGRRGRSKFLSRLSYRNHLLTLLKNEQWGNLIWDWPRIGLQEMKKAAYLALFEPATFFSTIPAVARALPWTLKKRRIIMKSARTNSKEIRKWFA